MERLPYWVLGGVLVMSIVCAAIVGGWAWIAPVAVGVPVLLFVAFDTRAKRREGRGERLAAR